MRTAKNEGLRTMILDKILKILLTIGLIVGVIGVVAGVATGFLYYISYGNQWVF